MRGLLFIMALIALSISAFALPDLYPYRIYMADAYGNEIQYAVPGQNVRLFAQVQNNGDAPASSFHVAFKIWGVTVGEETFTSTLNANTYTLMDTNYVVPSQTPDGHNVGVYSVVVDSRNEVNETNETNNEKITSLALSRPDVEIMALDAYDGGSSPITGVYPGQVVYAYVTLRITNLFQSFDIQTKVDGVTVYTHRYTPARLGPGTGYTNHFDVSVWTVTQSPLSARVFTVTVDPSDELNDTNKTNNQKSLTLPMVSRCGDGICESARGENSANCPTDCPPTSCTPKTYCSGNKAATQKADCSISYVDCGVSPPNCCKLGKCIKSFTECGRIADMTAPVVAQVEGPELMNALAVVSMVALVGIVLYSFIRIETDL